MSVKGKDTNDPGHRADGAEASETTCVPSMIIYGKEQGQGTISEFDAGAFLPPITDASASSRRVCKSNGKDPGARPGLTAAVVEDYRKLQQTLRLPNHLCFGVWTGFRTFVGDADSTGHETSRTGQPRALTKFFSK